MTARMVHGFPSVLGLVLLLACDAPQDSAAPDARLSADAIPIHDLGAPDAAGARDAVADLPDATGAPLVDAAPVECPPALAEAFESGVRPHLERCAPCHNSTVPAESLHSGGPQWFDPDEPAVTVEEILSRGLVDRDEPRRSLFRLKPLTRSGVTHAGGDLFLPGSTTDQAFITFLEHAAPCATAARPIEGFP